MPPLNIRLGDTDRSDIIVVAPLNVSVLMTKSPITGRVTPVATRTSAGISEK